MNFAISTIVGFSDFPLKLGLYAGAVSFLAAVLFAISALCGFREYKVILAAVNVLFAVLFCWSELWVNIFPLHSQT